MARYINISFYRKKNFESREVVRSTPHWLLCDWRVSFLAAIASYALKQIWRQQRYFHEIYTFLHILYTHDDVIKWKHFPRNWPFVRGIHRSPVNSPHKGQWRGALMSTLICARINGWVNTREAGDLRRYRPRYDVIVMICASSCSPQIYREHWYNKDSDQFSNFGHLRR